MESFRCANWSPTDTGVACSEQGSKACSRCSLVLYCGKECQTAHWPVHKSDCNSNIRKSTWRPAWERENRRPTFVAHLSTEVKIDGSVYGGRQNLFSEFPAIDLLRLKDNEGQNTTRDLSILLAATGDLRNLVETIVNLPDSYNGRISFDINDRNRTVVTRNLIILLAAFNLPPEVASTVMLHLWYSAFLPEWVMTCIKDKVLPALQDFNGNSGDGWSYKNATLRADSSVKIKKRVLSQFSGNSGIPFGEASTLRKAVTLAPCRQDYTHRTLFHLSPSWRLPLLKFRLDGVLLPFGASRENFQIPNPTFFGGKSWPMAEHADPLAGWDLNEVLQSGHKARNDTYGHLYLHVRQKFLKFCQIISTLKLNIRLFETELEKFLDPREAPKDNVRSYDRIEIGSLADSVHFGTEHTIGPLNTLGYFNLVLKPKAENPHAAILMFLLRAIRDKARQAGDRILPPKQKVLQFVPARQAGSPPALNNADFFKFVDATNMFKDFDIPFNMFIEAAMFGDIEALLGLGIKSNHTIVPKWPMRLKKEPTQHEFDMLLGSRHEGSERYVELIRTR
ncbi:hypothetical protein FQN55_006680 [Onygenales sp. PD_40]|nr:hypothetical protein FQN55_006680 [Onygenales sp. PD_40]KAK2795850.1 hypothetical protein FQN52_003700 [Onygenales sp. PD_12]KAK2798035.1 hypothetical protein FQN51_007960 [Onygenales sp. PD_10]